MVSNVFNKKIGAPYEFHIPKLSYNEEKQMMAELFEQLMIFDKITITTGRLNVALTFLIYKLGINNVERLLDEGLISFLLWSPVIVTSTGRQLADGSVDESIIYGKPPIHAGSLSADDLDPEKNIDMAFTNFQFHSERKKIFKQRALKNYIVPDGMLFSTNSADLIISAYKANNLKNLGLPYEKEPDQLNPQERYLLLHLGYKVLETAILAEYHLKGFENYDHFEICKQNLLNIGKAYNISENTSTILKLENLPDIKTLYLQRSVDFDSVFRLRELSTAKYYRKWIHEKGENANAIEITKEYLNEIKGSNKFFATTKGRLLKNLGSFGISTALGTALAGPVGAATGFAFGLLEDFWIENILQGKNPSMFIDEIKKEIKSASGPK